MSLKYFDLSLDTKWLPDDYLTMQLHNLNFENGIGSVQSTETTYDCRVVEVDENGKISKAVLQKKLEGDQYEQNTMPLKKVESLTNETKNGIVLLETYSPLYKEANPPQRYLFTVTSGARDEKQTQGA